MLGVTDYILFGGFAVFAAIDLLAPARPLTPAPLWRVKGVLAAATYWAVAFYSPFLWSGLIGGSPLIDGSDWPLWVAAPVALLAYQLGIYVWHRTLHASDFLWRHFHQTHHSAERIDIWGALYFHPLDVMAFTLVGSFMLTAVLGVAPEAVLFAFGVSTVCALFQHCNILTPRWLGYFVTRPESHSLHHERGAHRYNYGDIPVWDMVFGTFRNPEDFPAANGFWDGASQRLGDLLIGRDVAGQPLGRPSRA
ncbi:MAG: sterol desaturase family protein [Phenylobacterium sp.]|jgi:sterol desaturase/sphingolipid hydroxylase (fatty acid hydroxylase superfamily)|uniref:sterol desaturase family protein n=1 Tax=Phenylobacterium sp. TaxID=1871053 RepID=UPI002A370A24|nr:sterol desaturase family protein [Phenylobacterium sp.]MDX9997056.1 sterol desaturase family protein [Phenylobacterium sp.]